MVGSERLRRPRSTLPRSDAVSDREPFFTEQHDMFRAMVRQFVETELAPHAEEWEEAELFPREVFKKAGDAGLLGINYDEAYGGTGLDYWYTVIRTEEYVRSRCAGVNMALLVQSDMATPIIHDLGTEEQKQEFLVPAIKGDKIAALGVSEPGAGSDVVSLRTTARRDGGDYVINGSKTFITNGTRADFITLIVKTDPDKTHQGVSVVLVPGDAPGLTVGRKLKKLGNKASDTAELHFDNVRIPQRYLVGEEGHGFYYLMHNFQGERLVAAIGAVAGAQQLIEDALKYGEQRQAFGKPIIKFQTWRHEFAQHLTEVEAARRLAYFAADLFGRKVPCVREVSMAKLFCAELANKVADRCLQFHGGWGYMDEYTVSRAWRDARLVTIGGGTSEVMREIISKLSF
ncbi:MAG: acyl-CoA dehydrogenase family protein [Planctomycetes bacterium]|nr:acyl-CoA dehydrogenase family protein [Planctomycetota bacterium]